MINIGGEGQIALGGLAATWVALTFPEAPPRRAPAPGARRLAPLAGAAWAALAARSGSSAASTRCSCTLLLNFVGVLIVSEALQGALGEPGAGFPQSPLLRRAAWLPRLVRGSDLHVGILVASSRSSPATSLLWRTPFGFRLRVLGASGPRRDVRGHLAVAHADARVDGARPARWPGSPAASRCSASTTG